MTVYQIKNMALRRLVIVSILLGLPIFIIAVLIVVKIVDPDPTYRLGDDLSLFWDAVKRAWTTP